MSPRDGLRPRPPCPQPPSCPPVLPLIRLSGLVFGLAVGVAVSAGVQAVDECFQAGVGADLGSIEGADVFSALDHEAHAFVHQIADGGYLAVVLIEAVRGFGWLRHVLLSFDVASLCRLSHPLKGVSVSPSLGGESSLFPLRPKLLLARHPRRTNLGESRPPPHPRKHRVRVDRRNRTIPVLDR